MLNHRVGHSSNPFCSARIRPGTIPFLLPEGDTWPAVLDRFAGRNRLGQIVGPHGTGKTSALIDFVQHLRRSWGHRTSIWTAEHPSYSLREMLPILARFPSTEHVAIDGFDRLTWLARQVALWTIRARGQGLIVTTHTRHQGLPVLLVTNGTCRELAHALGSLLHDLPNDEGYSRDWLNTLSCQGELLLRGHRGNIREVLFELFDAWEVESRRLGGQLPMAPPTSRSAR